MDCPSIGLPGPFDFSAPHDLWFVALLPIGALLLGSMFISLKYFLERKFRRYPAKQPSPFFRWGERIAAGLYFLSILVWSIDVLWADAIHRTENNALFSSASGTPLDCFESFLLTEKQVLLYADIGMVIGIVFFGTALWLLRTSISSRHYITVQP